MQPVRRSVVARLLAIPAGGGVLAFILMLGSALVISSAAIAEEAPTAPSGPEAALQGTWKDRSGWVLVFAGRTFTAKSGTEWYKGSFSAPVTDDDPAPLNLDIDDCAKCAYKGMTSQSIYRWEDKGLLLSGATPGKSRPPIFDDAMGLVLDLTRVTDKKAP